MLRGRFITIEGSEGAGKSTAMQFISDYLKNINKEFILTREPGGTLLAEEIRQVLLHSKGTETINATTELLLMFAGRSQHISECIQPALHANKWVVSDRYIDASYAYQCGGRRLDINAIKWLDHFVVGSLYPDLTLLLDIPVDLGCARAEKRNVEKDRIEQEKMDFFVRVRNTYLERAKEDPGRIKIIDASQSLPLVQDQIRRILDEFIKSVDR